MVRLFAAYDAAGECRGERWQAEQQGIVLEETFERNVTAANRSGGSSEIRDPDRGDDLGPQPCRLDGEWVGSSAIFLRQGYGYLLGAQVLARARGRGGYRAMVAARLAWLAERGVGYAVTQARASTSAPILERLGFESLFESRCYRLDAERARPI